MEELVCPSRLELSDASCMQIILVYLSKCMFLNSFTSTSKHWFLLFILPCPVSFSHSVLLVLHSELKPETHPSELCSFLASSVIVDVFPI